MAHTPSHPRHPAAGAGRRHGAHPRWEPRTGSEPRTARSDLKLRLVLSRIFVPLFLAATAGFSVLAARAAPAPDGYRATFVIAAAIFAALFVIAVVDLVVVVRRRQYEREAFAEAERRRARHSEFR